MLRDRETQELPSSPFSDRSLYPQSALYRCFVMTQLDWIQDIRGLIMFDVCCLCSFPRSVRAKRDRLVTALSNGWDNWLHFEKRPFKSPCAIILSRTKSKPSQFLPFCPRSALRGSIRPEETARKTINGLMRMNEKSSSTSIAYRAVRVIELGNKKTWKVAFCQGRACTCFCWKFNGICVQENKKLSFSLYYTNSMCLLLRLDHVLLYMNMYVRYGLRSIGRWYATADCNLNHAVWCTQCVLLFISLSEIVCLARFDRSAGALDSRLRVHERTVLRTTYQIR